MEAIILVGGLGTRLQSVIKDVPKPMADINGKPFLEYILKFLHKYGYKKIVLSVGYKKESIIEYFGNSYLSMQITYCLEDSPLGTGGAIKKALTYTSSENVLVLNGDTFFNCDLTKMMNAHIKADTCITMALKPMQKFDRYGSVLVDSDSIIMFEEKGYKEIGLINAGIYILSRSIIKSFKENLDIFSFEKDFLEKYIADLKPNAYIEDRYFIDIGIPNDYEKAKKELNDHI